MASDEAIEEVKLTYPRLYYRHQILVAYNHGIQSNWEEALHTIDEVISVSEENWKELHLDALATKATFLGRLGFTKSALALQSEFMKELPKLSTKQFYGEGYIEYAVLFNGLSNSYLGERVQAIRYCLSAESFFKDKQFGVPSRLYLLALDCLRRTDVILKDLKGQIRNLDKHIAYAEAIEDWDSYIYGIVLKLEAMVSSGRSKEAYKLVKDNEAFIFQLPNSYDKTTFLISRFSILLATGHLNKADDDMQAIDALLSQHSEWNLLKAQFGAVKADFFEEVGDLENAIQSLSESKHYYQELYYKSANSPEVLGDYYESELSKRKSELLRNEQDIAALKLSKSHQSNRFFLIIALISVVLMSIIIYLYTVQRKLKKEQQRLASIDSLTGLMNRCTLLSLIEREIKRAKRDRSPSSLALIELDHFKSITDRFGHDVGDEVVKLFSNHVTASIGETDIFGRYGGEQFILCLPRTDIARAKGIIEKMLREYQSIAARENIELLSFSAGVTEFKLDTDLKSLIKDCDALLYQAKALGTSKVVTPT